MSKTHPYLRNSHFLASYERQFMFFELQFQFLQLIKKDMADANTIKSIFTTRFQKIHKYVLYYL